MTFCAAIRIQDGLVDVSNTWFASGLHSVRDQTLMYFALKHFEEREVEELPDVWANDAIAKLLSGN